MEHTSISRQLIPILLSAAMPGFGQLLQGRRAMAAAQFLITGALWSACCGEPTAFLLVLLAHGISAYSAATYRQPELA